MNITRNVVATVCRTAGSCFSERDVLVVEAGELIQASVGSDWPAERLKQVIDDDRVHHNLSSLANYQRGGDMQLPLECAGYKPMSPRFISSLVACLVITGR